jgi:hypothetical protein
MKAIFFLPLLLFTLCTRAQIPWYLPADSLVAWYPFNGNANDESGNHHNGQPSNVVLTADRFGHADSAYRFNGTSSAVLIPDTFFNIGWNSFTVSIWFNSTSINNTNNIFNNQAMINTIPHRGISVGFNWNSDNKYHFWAGTNPLATGAAGWDILGNDSASITNVSINRWNNITMVKDSTTWYMYLNGTLDRTFHTSLAASNYYCQFIIGTISPEFLPEAFIGALDDVGIWKRALSHSEISALFQNCSASGLIAQQPINHGAISGDTVKFTVSPINALSNYQWQSDLGFGFQNLTNAGPYSGVNTDTLTISNVSLQNSGQRFRCLISLSQCSDTSMAAVLNVSTVGINKLMNQEIFALFPNPATDEITVHLNFPKDQKFVIVNQLGQIVATGKLNSNTSTISIANLLPGIYLFQVANYPAVFLTFLKT